MVRSNGRNEPERSIFTSLKTRMRSGHPDPRDLLVTLRPRRHVWCEKQASAVEKSRDGRADDPAVIVIHVKVAMQKSADFCVGG